MIHASLFSGIGGPEIAAAMLGWQNAFHCEINPFGRAILNYWFPDSESYEDITKTDFRKWRGRIDVLTGGFPCQPFSYAGKRKGRNDERYLWPEMLRVIDEIRPTWVVGENVGGIATMVENGVCTELGRDTDLFGSGNDIYRYELRESYTLERICKDLEAIQYETQSFLIPACAVGAPHRRDRIFIVAYNADGRNDKGNAGKDAGTCETQGVQERDEIRVVGKPNNVRPEISRNSSNAACGRGKPQKEGTGIESDRGDEISFKGKRGNTPKRSNGLSTIPRNVADPASEMRDGGGAQIGRKRKSNPNDEKFPVQPTINGSCEQRIITDANGNGQCAPEREDRRSRPTDSDERENDVFARAFRFSAKEFIADANSAGLQRNGRPELQTNKNGGNANEHASVVSRMRPQNRWDGFPTVPPVHRGNDGLPFNVDNLSISFGKWRTESLKAYGNAIVPQVMFRIFEAIEFASKEK